MDLSVPQKTPVHRPYRGVVNLPVDGLRSVLSGWPTRQIVSPKPRNGIRRAEVRGLLIWLEMEDVRASKTFFVACEVFGRT